MADAIPRPRVVGIGGTSRPDSLTERTLAAALDLAEAAGAATTMFSSAELDLPIYAPERPDRSPAARRLVNAVARADGLIIASPGYHGGISGLVKNALDYLEDLKQDARPYLDGRAVGCIVCADGAQAGVTTLSALRATIHALRGWPTPLGITVNSAAKDLCQRFGPSSDGADEPLTERLRMLVDQVLVFARVWQR
jgi:FMN reductase